MPEKSGNPGSRVDKKIDEDSGVEFKLKV